MNIDFLVITGPTASGKTEFSLDMAKKLNGEIINADSVQVYKRLDIGSAKIKDEEKQGIPHHLISFKDPNEEYSIFDFQKDCNNKILEIKKRNKLPIIVGGSGLYINSVIYNYEMSKELKKNKVLLDQLNQMSNEDLKIIINNRVEVHINNRPRLLNYSYKILENIPIKENKKIMKNCKVICLSKERSKLYSDIDKRVDLMLSSGLLNEVSQFDRNWPSQTAIGYKEVHMYLNKEISYDDMIELIKKNTRHFAKRQITWFKNKVECDWYEKKGDIWELIQN